MVEYRQARGRGGGSRAIRWGARYFIFIKQHTSNYQYIRLYTRASLSFTNKGRRLNIPSKRHTLRHSPISTSLQKRISYRPSPRTRPRYDRRPLCLYQRLSNKCNLCLCQRVTKRSTTLLLRLLQRISHNSTNNVCPKALRRLPRFTQGRKKEVRVGRGCLWCSVGLRRFVSMLRRVVMLLFARYRLWDL